MLVRSKKTGKITQIDTSQIEVVMFNGDLEIIEQVNGTILEIEKPIVPSVQEQRKVTTDWTKKEILEYLQENNIKVENGMMMKKEDLIKLIV